MNIMNEGKIRTFRNFAAAGLMLLLAAGCSLGGIDPRQENAQPAVAGHSAPMSPYRTFTPANQAELHAEALQGNVNEEYLIVRAGEAFDSGRLETLGVSAQGRVKLGESVYYRIHAGKDSFRKAKRLAKLPGVELVEHETLYRVPEADFVRGEPPLPQRKGSLEIAAVLNDPETWGRFGHFELTGAIEAYRRFGIGTHEVYAALIDTGVNQLHEDFQKDGKSIVALSRSPFTSSDGGKTFEFRGFTDTFVDVPADENWDDYGHGTHVAGTIAAVGNNGKGVAGVAWDKVKLLSWKFWHNGSYNEHPFATSWAIYTALADLAAWKESQGITQTIPVNMSLGGSYVTRFEMDAVIEAQKHGILIIAAMSNDGYKSVMYPAALQGVLAVGATRTDGQRAAFSTQGNHISVAAPGQSIYSTWTESDTAYADSAGTSMAAPFVTGLAAYMLSFNPELAADQIRTIIEETATDRGVPGWDSEYGYGLVNVEKAIERVVSGRIPAPGERYASGNARITVRNVNRHYDSGLEAEGSESLMPGQPVYLYDPQGKYISHVQTTADKAVAEFSLLKTGRYVAKSGFLGKTVQTAFEIGGSGDVDLELSFDLPVLTIQTLYNAAADPGFESMADSVITLYDTFGNILSGPRDYEYLDALTFSPVAGQTCIVRIDPYIYYYDGVPHESTGEYGLVVSSSLRDEVNSIDGRGDMSGDDAMEENDSLAEAKAIELDREYGLYLGDSDYFSFTWNPASTGVD